MEASIRSPFQGVLNIIRFNWHFYVIALTFISILMMVSPVLPDILRWVCIVTVCGVFLTMATSLVVSHYVYDRSDLYTLRWLRELKKKPVLRAANIHAGFDETSDILKKHFPGAALSLFDFYDASRHTEWSIRRARKAYPPHRGTIRITTRHLPVESNSADLLFNIFALHEIRDRDERIGFLKRQRSALADDGRCIVVEHLRDMPNLLAYNIGFLHFFSESEWIKTFHDAGFQVGNQFKVTPFVTVFILNKSHGNTP